MSDPNMKKIEEELKLLEQSKTAKRLPICFCLDISGSMMGDPIFQLNNAISSFFHSLQSDTSTSNSAEISIITFGGDVKTMLNFNDIKTQFPPTLYAVEKSSTPLGKALELSISALEDRKNYYKENYIKYYQPWLVLITDAKPSGKNRDLVKKETLDAILHLNHLEDEEKLSVFCIGVGKNYNINLLKKISNSFPVIEINKTKDFTRYFNRLYTSSREAIRQDADVSETRKIVKQSLVDFLSDTQDEI